MKRRIAVKRRHQNPPVIRRIVFLLLLFLLHLQVVVSAKQEDSNSNSSSNNKQHGLPIKALKRFLEGCQHQAVKVAKCVLPLFHKHTSHALLFDAPTVVDDFLSADEAAALLQRYQPLLHASLEHGSTGVKKSHYRTSRSIRLPPLGDALVFAIEQRAAALANVSHSWVEDFQLACYDADELYGLHRDDSVQAVAGRAATVLVYLQAPLHGHGGSTLFTMRPLEDEVDLQRRQPLRTEHDALELFRSYCHKPRHHHVVVEAQTGRAVTWKNWKLVDDHLTFLNESTHGACPVLQGQKCVIQQWIAQSTLYQLPLRRDTIRAIVPLGADYAYHHHGDTSHNNDALTATSPYQQPMNDDNHPQPFLCLKDVSTQQGQYLSPLCSSHNAPQTLEVLDHGPYPNVGALRITPQSSGGFTTSLPASLVNAADGITILFWMRHNHEQNGAWEIVSVAMDKGQKKTQVTMQTPPPPDSSSPSASSSVWELACRTNDSNPDAVSNAILNQNEWVWVVLHVNQQQPNQIRVFSSTDGRLVWQAQQEFLPGQDDTNQEPSCTTQDDDNTRVELKFFTPIGHDQNIDKGEKEEQASTSTTGAAFVSNTRRQQEVASETNKDASSMDVSFLLIYAGTIDDTEAAQLRRQAVRYDILT